MKLVFCGTPEFAVPTLEAVLAAGQEVALVLTQPDRPAGRKMELRVSAVKQCALAHALPVLQPERIKKNQELQVQLEAIAPDAILVVAYGRIIPEWMLRLPRFGNINLHGSLLPKYRGAAPVQWAVANGEQETGVTTMQLDAGLDTGDVFLEHRLAIAPDAMATDVLKQLSTPGAALMLETLRRLEQGTLAARQQDHALATLAPILTREDGALNLHHRTAQNAYDRWRGFYPWPGAHASFRGKRFLVHRIRLGSADVLIAPGELKVIGDELLVGAAGSSTLVLDEVQLEGKPRTEGIRFARDYQLQAGERLD